MSYSPLKVQNDYDEEMTAVEKFEIPASILPEAFRAFVPVGDHEVSESNEAPNQAQNVARAKYPDSTQVNRLLRKIKEHIACGRISGVLACLRDQTTHMNAGEINCLATRTVPLLAAAGLWRACTEILLLLEELNVGPNEFSLTAAMGVYIRQRRFNEAMEIFEGMRRKNMTRDAVAFARFVES